MNWTGATGKMPSNMDSSRPAAARGTPGACRRCPKAAGCSFTCQATDTSALAPSLARRSRSTPLQSSSTLNRSRSASFPFAASTAIPRAPTGPTPLSTSYRWTGFVPGPVRRQFEVRASSPTKTPRVGCGTNSRLTGSLKNFNSRMTKCRAAGHRRRTSPCNPDNLLTHTRAPNPCCEVSRSARKPGRAWSKS